MNWAPDAAVLQFETTAGDQIVSELPRPTDLAPRRGRPVIYLDQNHWSTMANVIHAAHKVRQQAELKAAQRLIELATAGRVILPMSAGHMSETCKWRDNDARYRLALTILQLSAGWQMRDPLEVRRFELREALTVRFKSRCQVQPAVFTLEPDAIHGEVRGVRPYETPKDFPSEAAFAVRALGCVSGNFDSMLDAEHVGMDESPGWVGKLQQFTDWMAREPRDPLQRRQRTNAMFIADLGGELPEEACRAGISPDEMTEWVLRHSDADIGSLPSLGLFREVLHEKLLDPGTSWQSTDLTDMMYLTCAAGYADHVVAERRMSAEMRQGLRRLGRTAEVHRSLIELAEAI